jgi:hypothetical protein
MAIGRLGEPGPGFLPLIVGTLLALISIVLFINALNQTIVKQVVSKVGAKERFKIITTSLSLFLYAVILKPLGFVFVTFLLLFFLFKVIGDLGWKTSVIGPLIITLFFYFMFKVWLEVPFPMGPFGG